MAAKSSEETLKLNTLRADRKRINEILDMLDEAECGQRGEGDRSGDWHPWRVRLAVDVSQPGGSKAVHEVFTRNLSATGMSFLHGGYLHVGTACAMQLATVDNAWQNVSGTVVRCRNVGGRIHEAIVAFSGQLDLSQFLSVKLSGTVLLVDDAPDFAALMSYHLSKAGLKVVVANHGAQALKQVTEEECDLVVMDIEMPELDGITVTRTMRERGLTIPIIVLTAADNEENREKSSEAGCDAFLAKPIDRQQLVDVIRGYLNPEELITSKYADNPEMVDFIRDFATGLPARISQMQEQLQAGNAEKLLSLARQLKAIASGSGGCGFDAISTAAGTVVEAAHGAVDWEAAETAVSNLADMARRVKSTPSES